MPTDIDVNKMFVSECVKDLDKHNLVKHRNGVLVVGLIKPIFDTAPAAS